MIKYILPILIIISLITAACNSNNNNDIERGYTDVFATNPGTDYDTKTYSNLLFGNCATRCIAVYTTDGTGINGKWGVAIYNNSTNNYLKIFRYSTDAAGSYNINAKSGTAHCLTSTSGIIGGVADNGDTPRTTTVSINGATLCSGANQVTITGGTIKGLNY